MMLSRNCPRLVRKRSNPPVCTKWTKRPGRFGAQGKCEHKRPDDAVLPRGSTQGRLVGYHPDRVPGKPPGCGASLPSRKHYSWFTFPNILADEPERSIKRHLAFSALSRDLVEGERWILNEQMHSLDSLKSGNQCFCVCLCL